MPTLCNRVVIFFVALKYRVKGHRNQTVGLQWVDTSPPSNQTNRQIQHWLTGYWVTTTLSEPDHSLIKNWSKIGNGIIHDKIWYQQSFTVTSCSLTSAFKPAEMFLLGGPHFAKLGKNHPMVVVLHVASTFNLNYWHSILV